MAQHRIQKVLAQAGVSSRRGAEALITAGRVRIDGKVETELGTVVDPQRQRIAVDGRIIVQERPTYIVFHKPRGVVCTMSDPQGRSTISDHIGKIGVRVVPVGRLDYHTSGVLILTNDGDFSRSLSHPSGGVVKMYRVKLQSVVDDKALERFRQSITIDGRKTEPARVSRIRDEGDKSWLLVGLHEGRNRQIRRLAEYAGHRVSKLVRISFGGITAEGLTSGGWRKLSDSEVRSLKAASKAPKGEAATASRGAPTPRKDGSGAGPRTGADRSSANGRSRKGQAPRAPRAASSSRARRR